MSGNTAPQGRASEAALAGQIQLTSKNPVIDGVLRSSGGLLAVLNESRQILSVNDALLESLNAQGVTDLIGLRPGEALGCAHVPAGSDGCGTTPYCSTCGAAIAIVGSLSSNQPVERKCALKVGQDGDELELCFRVRACPVVVAEKRFLLLYLQDISEQERQASVERLFLHDIGNLILGLKLKTIQLDTQDPSELYRTVAQVKDLAHQLEREVSLQRRRLDEEDSHRAEVRVIQVGQVLDVLEELFSAHELARNINLEVASPAQELEISSDKALLLRVLSNMVINALEASSPGDCVRMWVDQEGDAMVFRVWNSQVIPGPIALRVFQRYFSTKEGSGRGIGTYGMKWIGEEILGGSVTFSSSRESGTVFSLSLPV